MYWLRRGVTALPCPLLTGVGALRAEVPWVRDLWVGHFSTRWPKRPKTGSR
jgi:hypothetical protein